MSEVDFDYVQACCRNDETLLDNGLCSDNKTNLIQQLCGGRPAFLLQPSLIPGDNFTILIPSGDLRLDSTGWLIPKGEYCLTSLNHQSIALACFKYDDFYVQQKKNPNFSLKT